MRSTASASSSGTGRPPLKRRYARSGFRVRRLRGLRPITLSKSGASWTTRERPAKSAIARFVTRSDSFGCFPRSASRSWSTTYGIPHSLQIRAKSGMLALPPVSRIRIPSLSGS
jgi:hypothetical protein